MDAFLDSGRDSFKGVVKNAKVSLGLEEERPPTVWEEINSSFSLSLKNRMYGCAICVGFAILFLVLAVFMIELLQLTLFGLFYTFANLCIFGSTFFIVGPMRQIKHMFKLHRIIASIVFIISLALTLVAAIYWESVILVLFFAVIQFCAFVWYIASYIPYAQDCMKSTCGGMCKGVVAV